MSRTYRLLAGFIAPPTIGAVLYCLFVLVEQFNPELSAYLQIRSALGYIPFIALMAFFFVGVQSITCALIVEFLILPLRLARSYFVGTYMLVSSLSGLVTGIGFEKVELFLPIGAIIGVILGLIVSTKAPGK